MTHHLPVAVHVARREAGRMIESGRVSIAAWDGFVDGMMRGVLARYVTGRKLSGEGYAALVDDVRRHLSGLSPVRLHEAARPATRAHPKGEAHEFLALVRYGNPEFGLARTGFVGLRVHVTRKRLGVDQEFIGLDVTRHALERAVEREVAGGRDGLARVEERLASHVGLVVVWRWAVVSRALSPEVALPIGEGLLLGRIERVPTDEQGFNLSYRLDRDGIGSCELPQNDLQVSYDAQGEAFMPFFGSTVVGEEQMRLPQFDLRDALDAFCARNADLLEELGACASWSTPALHGRAGFAELRDRLDVAADGLVRLLSHPGLSGALERRGDTGEGLRVAYPRHLMGDPQGRLDRVCAGLRRAA